MLLEEYRKRLSTGYLQQFSMQLLSAAAWLLAATATVSALNAQVYEEFPGVGNFYFNEEPLNWTDAYAHCKEMNGYLAAAESVPEANVLQKIMRKNEVQSIHIGFDDMHLEGAYFTILGTAVDTECINKWAPGAPIGGKDNNCGSLMVEGITDSHCSTAQPSICKLHLWESYGYEKLEGYGWYKYHTNKTTWGEAWETCRTEGAHLVIINSDGELAALHDRYMFIWAWVGAHHVYTNQQYITIFGQPLENTGFMHWRSGDPAGNNVDHPYLAVQSTDGLYTSRGDAHREFICEHEFTA